MIFTKQTRVLVWTTWIFAVTQVSCSLNLGLISGDHRRLSSPLLIKKIFRHSPVTINIHAPKSPLKSPSLLPTPLSKTLESQLKHLSKLKLPKVKLPSKIPKIPKIPGILPILPPLLPKVPLLPLPLLPLPLLPIIPPLPLLPLPILSLLPKSLKTPTLKKKTALQKALDTKRKPVIKLPSKLNKSILKTLLDLRKRGSLTTAEFLRFKKLLL